MSVDEKLNKHLSDSQSDARDIAYDDDNFDYDEIYGIGDRGESEVLSLIRGEQGPGSLRDEIEQRYSKELEAAQNADLEQAEQPSAGSEKPGEAQNEPSLAYELIAQFGDRILTAVGYLLMVVVKIISAPIKAIFGYSEKATGFAAKRAKKYATGFLGEMKYFRREIHSAGRNIRKVSKHPTALPSVIWYYIKKAIRRHKQLLRTLFNTALPAAALIIFVFTVNYWNGVTFALKVTYNAHEIGYISSEAVYLEAQELIKAKMDTGAFTSSAPEPETLQVSEAAAAKESFDAHYSISLVSLEEICDAQTICDRIIENSVDNLTNACGVYIDGKFVCAVKNEADAKTVFNKIIAPYEEAAAENDYIVNFAQTIDYAQGLYPDDDGAMLDAAQLETLLNSPVTKQLNYEVKSGDSLESIAADYEMSEDELRAMNPGYDWALIARGDSVKVGVQTKYINVQRIVTSTAYETIEHDTQKEYDSTKYSGYRVVKQKGSDGKEKVTTTTIYVDDSTQGEVVVEREVITEPVDEIVLLGSNNYYGGIYVGSQSDMGFLWPAPSCHSVSSPFGWRSSGWHKGTDLVRSGGGASGTAVIASKSGTVEYAGYSNTGYGYMVLINHGGGYKTRYAHMREGSIRVSVGDHVDAGEQIGRVGSTGNSTGPHLHFEVIYNGTEQNAMNYIG